MPLYASTSDSHAAAARHTHMPGRMLAMHDHTFTFRAAVSALQLGKLVARHLRSFARLVVGHELRVGAAHGRRGTPVGRAEALRCIAVGPLEVASVADSGHAPRDGKASATTGHAEARFLGRVRPDRRVLFGVLATRLQIRSEP